MKMDEEKPTAIAVRPDEEVTLASPLDMDPVAFKAALTRREENRKTMLRWVKDSLVRGTDFGQIHVVRKDQCQRGKWCKEPSHFSKECLFKPGAEKICGMLGVQPRYPDLVRYEEAAIAGTDLKHVTLRCELVTSTGTVVAHGIGARSMATDRGDLNKALKMAAKSAHIDATLRLAGLSEIFTLDLEDMIGEAPEPAAASEPPSGTAEEPPHDPVTGEVVLISEPQRKRLEARISELGLDRARVKKWVANKWGLDHFTDLDQGQYADLDSRLEGFAKADRNAPKRAVPPPSDEPGWMGGKEDA